MALPVSASASRWGTSGCPSNTLSGGAVPDFPTGVAALGQLLSHLYLVPLAVIWACWELGPNIGALSFHSQTFPIVWIQTGHVLEFAGRLQYGRQQPPPPECSFLTSWHYSTWLGDIFYNTKENCIGLKGLNIKPGRSHRCQHSVPSCPLQSTNTLRVDGKRSSATQRKLLHASRGFIHCTGYILNIASIGKYKVARSQAEFWWDEYNQNY